MDSRPFVVFSDRPSTPVPPEAMQRQGLVEAFRQTAGRRLVPILQLMLERLEGGEGLVVLRTVVGALETLPATTGCSRLATSRTTFSRACATDTVAPGRGGGRLSARPPGAPCRHPRYHQKPLGDTRGPARPMTGGTGSTPSRSPVSVSTTPRNRLSPRHRDAQRDDHRRLGERLAVQHEGHDVLPGEVPLLELAEFRRAGLNERAGQPSTPIGRSPWESPRRPPRRLRHEIPYSTRLSNRSLTARDRHAAPRTTAGESRALRDMANPGHANRHALAGQTRPSRGCCHDGARRLTGLCGHSARQPALSLPR